MKQVIIMMSFFIAAPIFANSDYRYSQFDGIWKDRYNEKIEIRNGQYGLEVKKKGLFRKTRTFEEVSYNTFEDYDGNIIEIISNNQIVLKNRYNRNYQTFYRGRYLNNNNVRRQYNNRSYGVGIGIGRGYNNSRISRRYRGRSAYRRGCRY